MDHRDIIASLTAEQRDRLTERSDRAGLAHLSLHWGLIVAFGALIAIEAPYWWALMLPQGILIVFLFTLLHEAVHKTPFRSDWLNTMAARVSGFLLLLGADWFRYFHFAHHRYTQDPDNDPELAEPKPETLRQYIVHVSGLPVYWSEIRGLAANALGRGRAAYIPTKGEARVRREAMAMIALYALLLAGSIWFRSAVLLWVWIVPALIGQPFLRLYLLAEHGRCPFVANMLENTRTTATNRAVRFLAWNMPYHAEHHSYPAVPFHRLPEFHAIVQAHLKETERGYARFNAKYIASLNQPA
ncbi:MAG: fatty acid desaturase family protein [Rhizobiaceae bacterium]|nr:fatty acid desaturase family protein [Rhizobiaceae bacterium]